MYRILSGRFEPPGNQVSAGCLAADANASCRPLVRIPDERLDPFRTPALHLLLGHWGFGAGATFQIHHPTAMEEVPVAIDQLDLPGSHDRIPLS